MFFFFIWILSVKRVIRLKEKPITFEIPLFFNFKEKLNSYADIKDSNKVQLTDSALICSSLVGVK